jgi:hypothetical protein
MITHMHASEQCKRINSFVVVDEKFDFGTDYVEKMARSPFYFSRTGKLEFPCLVISEYDDTLSQYKNDSYKRYTHNFEIGIIDKQGDINCTSCTACEKRKPEVIERDTKYLLNRVLNEISHINLYLTQPDNVYKYGIEPVMEILVTANKITSFERITRESNALKQLWKTINPQFRLIGWKNVPAMLIGAFTICNMAEICHSEDFEYMFKNISKTKAC